MFLIAGLGNPGSTYENTRHNIGQRVVKLWGREVGARKAGRRFQSALQWAKYQNEDVLLLRPLTYMNQSGRPIKACADFYAFETAKILVIHDDLDLPVGRIKVVKEGGAGGHKGIRSVIEHLGSRQFPRIKIGIGRPLNGESIEDYVLAPFYADQKGIVEEVIRIAVDACGLVVDEGVESAMNKINCQILASKEEES